MSQKHLSNDELCQALMRDLCEAIFEAAAAQVGYLKHGPQNRVEADMGKEVLTLDPLSGQQLDALERLLCKVQEHVLGGLFALVDGSAQPPGWPDEIRLVNMDTGEVICPEGLQWAFGLALAEHRAQIADKEADQDK